MDPFAGALFAGLGFSILMIAVLPSFLMLVSLIYVALRVRDARNEHPDPELGLKTVYWLLYTIGIVLVHMGFTVLVSHWLSELELTGPARMGRGAFGRGNFADDEWSSASRTGWALVASGSMTTIAFYLIASLGTRNREWPTVRRVFTGGRIAVAGLIVIVTFTFLMVMQFQKDLPPGGIYETSLAAFAVWLPSLAIHVFLFRWGGTPKYHVQLDEPSPKRSRPNYIEEDELPEVTPAPPANRNDAQLPQRRRMDDIQEVEEDERPRRRPRDVEN